MTRFIPFGIMGRVLEPISAAYWQKQVTTLNDSPTHPSILFEHLWVWYIAKEYLSSALMVSWHCPLLSELLSSPGLKRRILHYCGQSTTDCASANSYYSPKQTLYFLKKSKRTAKNSPYTIRDKIQCHTFYQVEFPAGENRKTHAINGFNDYKGKKTVI